MNLVIFKHYTKLIYKHDRFEEIHEQIIFPFHLLHGVLFQYNTVYACKSLITQPFSLQQKICKVENFENMPCDPEALGPWFPNYVPRCARGSLVNSQGTAECSHFQGKHRMNQQFESHSQLQHEMELHPYDVIFFCKAVF